MKRSKLDRVQSTLVAAQMAAGWSDEYIKTKTAQDLVTAYGCTEDNAKYVLLNELTKRKTLSIKAGKELD